MSTPIYGLMAYQPKDIYGYFFQRPKLKALFGLVTRSSDGQVFEALQMGAERQVFQFSNISGLDVVVDSEGSSEDVSFEDGTTRRYSLVSVYTGHHGEHAIGDFQRELTRAGYSSQVVTSLSHTEFAAAVGGTGSYAEGSSYYKTVVRAGAGRVIQEGSRELTSGSSGSVLTEENAEFLSYWRYDEPSRRLVSDKAIETTLNSLYLGEQHKMSSGSENIYFTNLTSDINFFPMWGGLKDHSISTNRDASGFIPPSGRVYTNMFSLPLRGNPDPLTAVPYGGDNYFGVNISGLGITTVAAEEIPATVRLEYRIRINGKQVYMQELPRNAARSSAGETIYPGDVIEWWFDHPVDVHAGTSLYAEIRCVRNSDDTDLGIFLVRQGDTPNADGSFQYQATVHNRLYEDKDLELISPYLKYQAMDFQIDPSGSSIRLRDLALGTDSVLVSYPINTLQAVADGTTIQIKLLGGQKVLVENLPVSATSINGSFVNAVLNQAVTELNSLFSNTLSFSSQGNAVSDFALIGNDLTITLADGTSYTQDVTSFGVDENNFVVSGAVSGTDLILTMSDASTVTIDATNLVGGSTLSATNEEWYISYGSNANTAVGATSMDTTLIGGVELRNQGPYYFGQELTRGAEFKFNVNTDNQLKLGIWDGAAVATAYNSSPSMMDASNWNTAFSYANGTGKFTDSTNTDITTYHASGYTATSGAPMSIRFGSDGHLTLMDLSGGNEVTVGKTTIALNAASINLQMGGWSGSSFPNGIISDSGILWSIVHDYAGTEAGVLNGVLTHTVLKRNLVLSPGEQYMIPLAKQGAGETFGIDYTNAATGVVNAEESLVTSFKYQTNESIIADVNWTHNTASSRYFTAGGGTIPSWRDGDAGTEQGLFSLRYMTDNTLELWSETYNDLVATSLVHPNGDPINLFFGVNGNTSYIHLPVVSKQNIGQGSQPDNNFVPTVADQTVTVTEGDVLSFQIVSSDNIVNQFAELDAPSWMTLNQNTGVLSGTAPAFVGTSADTIVVNCKAGNAIGGTVDFTVTVTVAQVSYTNSNSLSFNGTTSFLQGNPVNMTALERTSNGDGSAWTISLWVKPSSSTANNTLLVYGAGDDYNGGAITLKQQGGTSLVLNYGTVYNSIILVSGNALTVNTWQHVMITFDGGTTGSVPADSNLYYSRFDMYVDGALQSNIGVATNGGYDGVLSGANPSDNIFRIGRASNVHNNYFDGDINQVAIWDTDQTANLATIYNSGSVQNLSLLASPPTHYYEMESSVTTVTDISGSADLTGYNFVPGDLVSDTP